MVIRRIRDHAATHDWFAVAVDLAIVILGVFLGLQANNWNAARMDNAEARGFRSQIITNLRANETDILDRLDYYRQVRIHALAALQVFENQRARPGEQFLIDSYLATMTNRRPLERSAYDEMISSGVGRGNIGLRTRSRMSAFYAQIPQFNDNVLGITAYKERLRRAMPYSVQEQIGIQCRDVVRTLPTGAQKVTMPDACRITLPPKVMVAAVARLKATDGLDADLTRQLADVDQKLLLFRRYAKLAHELRVDLEANDRP